MDKKKNIIGKNYSVFLGRDICKNLKVVPGEYVDIYYAKGFVVIVKENGIRLPNVDYIAKRLFITSRLSRVERKIYDELIKRDYPSDE